MRVIIGAISALAVGAAIAPAAAADLTVKPRPVVPVVDVYNWTGFNVGGNVGYSWGRADADVSGTFSTITRTRQFRTASGPGPGPGFTDVTTGPVVAAATGTSRGKFDGVGGGVEGG